MIYNFVEIHLPSTGGKINAQMIWLININAYIWVKFVRMDIKPFCPHLTFSTLPRAATNVRIVNCVHMRTMTTKMCALCLYFRGPQSDPNGIACPIVVVVVVVIVVAVCSVSFKNAISQVFLWDCGISPFQSTHLTVFKYSKN